MPFDNNKFMTADENNPIFEMATAFVNETWEHVFLTGRAGTGKTTFLRHIRQATHKHAIVTAPTGVAAINAGGVTLHSLFQLAFEPYVPGYATRIEKEKFRFGKAKLDLLRQLELLIIDEVSMLRADTLDAIDLTLRKLRHNAQPFGGVQVLYIGDMFQLPPVVKDDEWNLLKPHYESAFFFHAQVVRKTQPVYLELKKVYRQTELLFVELLNNVRNNRLSATDLARLNARYRPDFIPHSDEKYITLTTHNYKADRLNKYELDKLPGREYVFTGEIKGDFPDYALPTDMQLRLKTDAQVMFIKNDADGRYFNGKIATVCNLHNDKAQVRMPDSDEVVDVPLETWNNIRYTLNNDTGEMEEETIGSYKQYPLRLAWAVTIHKSQGLTFDRAIIDIGDSFAPGQAYVALSRCTSLEGVVLRTPVTPHSIITDANALRFSQSEKQESELQQLLDSGKRTFWRERLLRYFDWNPMFAFLRAFERLLDDKTTEEYAPAHSLLNTCRQTVRTLDDVAARFRQQLLTLTAPNLTQDDLMPLRERCRKAVTYFHAQLVADVLTPLQRYIAHASLPKRARTFKKNLIALESDIVRFIENMKRVRYNNVLLLDDDLPLAIPERTDVFTPAPDNKPPRQTDKIDTRQQTLALYESGLSAQQIAVQRHLSISTIESHLAAFAGTQIAIGKLLTVQQLDEIRPLVAPLLNDDHPTFKQAYDQAGGKYTYGQLRMVYSYLKNSVDHLNVADEN